MLEAITNLGLFGSVEAGLEIPGQISGYAAQPADMDVLLASVAGWAGCANDSFVAAARAAVDRMVDAEIAYLLRQRVLNDAQECGRIAAGVAVQLNVGDGSRIAQSVERCFQLDFLAALMW